MCEVPTSCRPSCAFLSPGLACVEEFRVLFQFFQPLHAVIWSSTRSEAQSISACEPDVRILPQFGVVGQEQKSCSTN